MVFKKEWKILLLLAIILIAVRAPFLEVPFERDEGEYASLAWQMEQGVMPYRDIITYISPGIFFLYRIAFFLFDYSVRGIRLFTLVYLLITLGLFYYFARMLLSREAALLAGVIFIFLTTDPSILANMSQREIFAVGPLLMSFIVLQKDLARPKWYYALGNGFTMAMAFMIKPTAVFHLFFIFGVCCWYYIRHGEHTLFWQRIVLLISGLALGICPFIVYFGIHKSLPDFFYWTFVFPKVQSKAIGVFYPTFNHVLSTLSWKLGYTFKSIFFSQFPYGFLVLAALLITLFKRKKETALCSLWFLSLLLSTAAGLHFRPQYFQLIIVPQSFLAAWTMHYICQALAKKTRSVRAAYIMSSVLALFPFITMMVRYYFIGGDMISKKLYGPQLFTIAMPIAQHVAKHTAPSDKIYILGSEPEIYFYSQRGLASNHITAYTLTYAYGDPIARQKDVVQTLTKNPPSYIILVTQECSLYDFPAVHKNNIIFMDIFDLIKLKYILDGFGYINMQKQCLVLGQKTIARRLSEDKTLDEQLDYIYKIFNNCNPAVLLFRRAK